MPALTNDLKTKISIRAGWLTALAITAWALFSPWGAIRHYQLSKDIKQLDTSYQTLQEVNRQLQEEVDSLSNNPNYIENIARKKHGLLKTNEFLYVFPYKK